MQRMSSFDIPEKELIEIINNAPNEILKHCEKMSGLESGEIRKLNKQIKHKILSQGWVKYLSMELEKYYREAGFNKIYTLPGDKIHEENILSERKEFLFDISLGEYDHFISSAKKSKIYFQSNAIWQVESEFEKDMRKIAIDFSKLIAGDAPYKMMVAPLSENGSKNYRADMKPLAEKVNGTLYFLFLRHPSTWLPKIKKKDQKLKWEFYLWKDNKWDEIESGVGSELI